MIPDPVHFVGIGGYGMSGLAEVCLSLGLRVQGSDARLTKNTERLASLGATIFAGHSPDNVTGARTVVLSTAITESNLELSAARAASIPVIHRSDLLAHLMAGKKAITVTGTHGKTTTTALISHVMSGLGLDPTTIVGGTLNDLASTARVGKSGWMIAEADESDGSFLKYQPLIAVVTNVAPDHLDYWKTEDSLVDGFRRHFMQIQAEGCAVVGWDLPLTRKAAENLTVRRLTFGKALGAEVRLLQMSLTEGWTEFKAVVEHDVIEARLPLIGVHNVENALACLAVVRALGEDVRAGAKLLATFPGVDRRLSCLHRSPDLVIYDDYAHNPGKIAACVTALKAGWPGWRLHVVFQPHRFSRLETMFADMIGSLAGADNVYVVPVYSAGETAKADYSPQRLAIAIGERHGVPVESCISLMEAKEKVKKSLSGRDVVLTVGAGDVNQVAGLLRDEFQ